MLWMIILIVGYVLFFSLLLFYKEIIEVFQNTSNQFSPIKYALIVGGGVASCFIVWSLMDLFNPMNNIIIGGYGLCLLLLPPIATLVGAGGFLVSWAVIIIFILFSQKYRSTIPPKKLVVYVLLAIVILSFTFWRTYTFISTKLLFRDIESLQTSQTRLSEIYAKAIKKGDTRILGELAINPNISIQILEEIYASYQQYPANAKYYSIFVSLAKNKNTPVKILEDLVKKQNVDVRHYVADNPNTPVETLRILADDGYYLIRTAVVYNRNTPRDILLKLKSDRDEEVKKAANLMWNNRGFDKTSE